MKQRKNAVDLTDLAVGIIVLGIVVTIGATILLNIRDTNLTNLSTFSTGNESVVGSNTTAVVLDNTWFKSVTLVTNKTGGETLLAGNYSTSVDGNGNGQFLIVGSQYNGEDLNVTYNAYNTSSRADWTLADSAATGLAEYGNWFDIIVIVGVAAVILALIFMAFGGSRDSGQSGVAY